MSKNDVWQGVSPCVAEQILFRLYMLRIRPEPQETFGKACLLALLYKFRSLRPSKPPINWCVCLTTGAPQQPGVCWGEAVR